MRNKLIAQSEALGRGSKTILQDSKLLQVERSDLTKVGFVELEMFTQS